MTLTQTAQLTKQLLVVFTILIFVGLTSWIGIAIYINTRPAVTPPPTPPNFKYGILPPPLFPTSVYSNTNYTYALDTETGDLPAGLPNQLKVFFVPIQEATLTSSEKAAELAKKFGFNIGPEVKNQTIYQFRNLTGGSFGVDINTNNFQFQKPESTDSAKLESNALPDQNQIIKDFKTYLSKQGVTNTSLESGRGTVLYNQTDAKNSAYAIVSLFPDTIDNLPSVTPSFVSGLTRATYTKSSENNNDRYQNMQFIYWQPDETNFGTYPIKPVEKSFEELQSEGGIIIKAPDKTRISITSIYLAYYQPETYPTYIQPVYVFEGPDFVAYVDAIDNNPASSEASASATPN